MKKHATKLKHKLAGFFKNKNRFKKVSFVAGFVVVGILFVYISQAASPFVALEPESATLVSPATQVADVTASGGSAVQFRNASSTNGVESCGLYANDEACWATNTGVINKFKTDGTRWTEDQILNDTLVGGHRPSEQLGQPISGQYNVNVGGTAASPRIYENLYIRGCISITASNVLIRNVYYGIDSAASKAAPNGQNSGQPPYGCTTSGGTNPSACGAARVHACTGLTNVRIEDSEFNGGAHINGPNVPGLLLGNGLKLERVNAHGSNITYGYASNSTVTYSYLHDVTDGHEPCYWSNSCPAGGDMHSEPLRHQGDDNWSVTHSFIYAAHGNVPQSSGGCLCNDDVDNTFMEDLFLYGGQGVSINLGGAVDHGASKVVWHRLNLGNGPNYDPSSLSDYVTPYGSWTPASYDSYGVPVIPNSRCGQVRIVNAAGGMTSTLCN